MAFISVWRIPSLLCQLFPSQCPGWQCDCTVVGMTLTPLLIVWIVLALATAILALVRKFTAHNEDDYIHISGSATVIPKQEAMAAKLRFMDRLGKILTALTVALGVALAGMTLWEAWTRSAGQ